MLVSRPSRPPPPALQVHPPLWLRLDQAGLGGKAKVRLQGELGCGKGTENGSPEVQVSAPTWWQGSGLWFSCYRLAPLRCAWS